MYHIMRIKPDDIERKIYTDASEYGIICGRRELKDIISRLDKYIKKTKVASKGLDKKFGHIQLHFGTPEESFYEWSAGVSVAKGSSLKAEQGSHFFFEIMPNRHYILKDNISTEVYRFPERKDINYYFILGKFYWYYEDNGTIVYCDDEEDRIKRQEFFDGLLKCIGFPLEKLYTYDREEQTWRFE